MATLAELQLQLARLETARATGKRSIQSEGDRVEYFAPGELQSAIDRVRREIALLSEAGRRRRVQVQVEKGL